MKVRACSCSGISSAKAKKTSGNFPGKIGEVFCPHFGFHRFNAVFAKIFSCMGDEFARQIFVIEDKGISPAYSKFAAATHGLRDSIGDTPDDIMHLHSPFFVESPYRTFKSHSIRDDIGPPLPYELANCHNSGNKGIGIPADDLLQGHYDMRCDKDGVNGCLRHCAMSSFPFHGNKEFIRRSHEHARSESSLTGNKEGENMLAYHKIGFRVLHDPGLDHLDCAPGIRLLGRLEKKFNRSAELFFQPAKDLCGAQQAGHMHIMTTCMHDTRIYRFIADFICFINRQRIHIGPESQACRLRLAALNDPDDPESAHIILKGNTIFPEPGSNEIHRVFFLFRQFRMPVNMTADVYDF